MSSFNINDQFFQGSYKEAWKQLMPPGLTAAEVEFITEIGQLKAGDRVLDLMCGYGRHALALAQKGLAVTAVDNLPDYIRDIQSSAAASGIAIEAVQASALDYVPETVFDAVICMGNSFAFFDQEDATGLLQKIASCLAPEGVVVINSWMIAEIALKYFKEKDWHRAGDYTCILDYRYLFHPSRIESEQTIIAPDGSIEKVKGVDYIYTLDDLENMFRAAGLTTQAVYSTPRKKKFVLGDNAVYVVAQKVR